jgi:hypothetical protein
MNLLIDNKSELQTQLELLASIEPTDVNFLTCHLDTTVDRSQVQMAFRRLQLSHRKTLNSRQLVDFDHAVKMVEDFLEKLDNNTPSIMIFCRSILGGQFFSSIPLTSRLANKLFFQTTPAVAELVDQLKPLKPGIFTCSRKESLHQEVRQTSGSQRAPMALHIEKDENSYSLAGNSDDWPAGPPLALQCGKGKMPGRSLDLVA